MKTFYITRHAKSSWEDFSLPDHERPLLPKGRRKTRLVAQKLKETGNVPGLIISSSAKRARQTAEILAEVFAYPGEKIVINKALYLASDDRMLEQLYGIDNMVDSVMIVAHNPGLTDLVNNFTKDYIANLPTSGVAKVVFDTDRWEDIDTAKHHLEFILTPKMLGDSG
jgi:phosphohistidine phosphatase